LQALDYKKPLVLLLQFNSKQTEGGQMSFLTAKVAQIKEQARHNIRDGAVTPSYGADVNEVIEILNEALASEIVCVLRYRHHYQMAKGMDSEPIAAEFLEHAEEEQKHADWLAERITQLNGKPNHSPVGLAERSHTDFVECDSLEEMVKENLIAERIAIDLYREMILHIGDRDTTTKILLEKILQEEEEHADDLANFMD
jgi:bacterioferritin